MVEVKITNEEILKYFKEKFDLENISWTHDGLVFEINIEDINKKYPLNIPDLKVWETCDNNPKVIPLIKKNY